jgi:tRNA A-37 threonylcarbamoyl transferase component Bud32
MSDEAEPTPTPPPDLTGQIVAGRYKIERRLGEGGMGVVYAAIDTRLEKPVAIKILKEDFAHREDIVARFTLEAKSAAQIKHENVLDVTDWGPTEDGSFFLVMERLVGTDLADVLHEEGTIELQRALSIGIQITRALGAAHAKGVVHRDLKPENVFLVASDEGREIVKIVDFGIAQMKDAKGGVGGKKLTQTGMIFGTPEYMSPEQARGAAIDHRVDIYAVGVILYEMACGRTPFKGDAFMAILTQHLYDPAPAIRSVDPQAQITPAYEQVIARALAKLPDERYQTMKEFGADLARVRDGVQTEAATAVISAPNRPKGSVGLISSAVANPTHIGGGAGQTGAGRSRAAIAAIAAGVIVIGGGVAFKVLGGKDAGGSPPRPDGPSLAVATDAGIVGRERPTVEVPADPSPRIMGADADVLAAAGTDAASTPTTVRVRFESEPSGARVFFQGIDEPACSGTPCEIPLAVGERRTGYAVAANRRGEFTVTATGEGQRVDIALDPARRSPHRARSPQGTQPSPRSDPHCRPGQRTWFDPSARIFRPC